MNCGIPYGDKLTKHIEFGSQTLCRYAMPICYAICGLYAHCYRVTVCFYFVFFTILYSSHT